MSKAQCPGQDTRFWRPGDIFEAQCAVCGNTVEFFKDDATRRCSKCGQRVQNPRLSLGCAQWCEHAKECLGYDPQDAPCKDNLEVSLLDKLVIAMKKEFGADQNAITRSLIRLENAQALLKDKKADPRSVMVAALLLNVGADKAEAIMKDMKMDATSIDNVIAVINAFNAGAKSGSAEVAIISDADNLTNLSDKINRK